MNLLQRGIEHSERGKFKLNMINCVDNAATFPFRRSIPRGCATFPIQQEAVVRNKSHPVAHDDKVDNNRRQRPEGRDSCVIKSFFPQCSEGTTRVCGAEDGSGQRKPKGDAADSAISHRMLKNASLTTSSSLLSGFKCGEGQEF